MYPGDVLDGDELRALSPYRDELSDGGLEHLVPVQYGSELEHKRRVEWLDDGDAASLVEELRRNLADRAPLLSRDQLAELVFTVRITDVRDGGWIDVRFDRGRPVLERADGERADSRLRIETSSRVLRYSFSGEWCGDVITIGYGCEIHVADRDAVARQLDTACVRLLTRHPAASRQARREPLRAARYLASNPLTGRFALARLRQGRELRRLYDGELWLSHQVRDLPDLRSAAARRRSGREPLTSDDQLRANSSSPSSR
jgi:hypothetical protein